MTTVGYDGPLYTSPLITREDAVEYVTRREFVDVFEEQAPAA